MKLTKTLLVGSASVIGLTPVIVAPLTSCSNSNAKEFSVTVRGQTVKINTNKAVEGQNFKAKISADYEIILVRDVIVDGVYIPFNLYSFDAAEDKLSGTIEINSAAIEGNIIIDVVTRTNENELYVNVTDGLDNAGFYAEDPWIPRTAIQDDFDFEFDSDYPIATSYPDPATGEWKQWIEVWSGDEIIQAQHYQIEAIGSFSKYVIHFYTSQVELKGDITIKVARLSTISGVNDPDEKMAYYNEKYQDDYWTLFTSLRGYEAYIHAMYMGDEDPSRIQFNNFKVYINNALLPKEYYEWKVMTSVDDSKWCLITVHSYAVLGDITVDADITIK